MRLHLPKLAAGVALLTVIGVAPPAGSAFAHEDGSHAHGRQAETHGDKPGAGPAGRNPPPASLGGAISGQTSAGKDGNSVKGREAEGVRPH